MLILCEVTTYLSWFDITTGLIEGWQLFEDGLRGDHPLLPAETWKTALGKGGSNGSKRTRKPARRERFWGSM